VIMQMEHEDDDAVPGNAAVAADDDNAIPRHGETGDNGAAQLDESTLSDSESAVIEVIRHAGAI